MFCRKIRPRPVARMGSGYMPFRDGTGPKGKGRGHGRGRGLGMVQGRRLSSQKQLAQTAAITINSEKCIGCGKCVSVCPTGALSLADGKVKLDQVRCKGCRACVDACPTGAIT